MRVDTINNQINFGMRLAMVIPSDIDKILKTKSINLHSPVFDSIDLGMNTGVSNDMFSKH